MWLLEERGGGKRVRELEKGGQKVQTSNYKIDKDAMDNMMTVASNAV